jgi:hypothetical protein
MSKNIKATNYDFFHLVRMTWNGITQKTTFQKSKNVTHKQQPINAPLLIAPFPAYQNFIIYFKET